MKNFEGLNTTLILGEGAGGTQGEGIDNYVHYVKMRAILWKCLSTFVPHCSFHQSFRGTPMANSKLGACLHGSGGPQVGEVTCGRSPQLSCKRDQIKMRDHMDRGVTHLSGLPHLLGVPQLHVNRPLFSGSNRPRDSARTVYIRGGSYGFTRDFKIGWLRTTATVKYATAHDQKHVTVHFSRVALRLRWVAERFRVVATTKNIFLAFCRLGNSRISSFRKKVFNSPAFSERESKYVSCVYYLLRFTLLIYRNHLKLWLHSYLKQ